MHFRDPGQTQKEDLQTGLSAAVAGGYTAVVAMPNTSPIISSVDQVIANENSAKKIDLAQLYQVISISKDFKGMDTSHLDEFLKHKSKTTKVISEDGHDVLSPNILFEAMQKAAKAQAIIACHCEDPLLVKPAREYRVLGDFAKAEEILKKAENTYTERNIELAQKAGCHIHICHISTSGAISAVKKAKESGVRVTAEATPHHLALNYEANSGGHQLVNPPLRSEEDRQAVITGLKDGTIDCIATDHAPHTLEDKKNGACGFTGIEVAFSVVNTFLNEGLGKNSFSLSDISKYMSANPARILTINAGQLQKGYAANLVLVDSKKEFVVDSTFFYSKGTYTPFDKMRLKGVICQTWKDGKNVYRLK